MQVCNQKVPSLFTLIYINNLFQSTFVVSDIIFFPKLAKQKKTIMITQAGFIYLTSFLVHSGKEIFFIGFIGFLVFFKQTNIIH